MKKKTHMLTRLFILFWLLLKFAYRRFLPLVKRLQGHTRNIFLIIHVYGKLDIFSRIFHRLRLFWLFFRHNVWGVFFVFHPGKSSVFRPFFRWFRFFRRLLKKQFRKLLRRFVSHLVRTIQDMLKEVEGGRARRYRHRHRYADREDHRQREEQLEETMHTYLRELQEQLREFIGQGLPPLSIDRIRLNTKDYLL